MVRRYTPLRRYACGTCGHHGWTTVPIGATAVDEMPSIPGRPLESRDRRRILARRKQAVRAILIALALGGLVAWIAIHSTVG